MDLFTHLTCSSFHFNRVESGPSVYELFITERKRVNCQLYTYTNTDTHSHTQYTFIYITSGIRVHRSKVIFTINSKINIRKIRKQEVNDEQFSCVVAHVTP